MLVQLLERIDKDEFETLSEDIKLSFSEHREWMRKVNIAVVCREKLIDKSFVDLDAHLHCKFGQWIKHILSDEIFQQESFLNIDKLHQEIHSSVRKLIESIEDAPLNIVKKRYEKFLAIQKVFFDEVLLLFEFSVVNKHQFDLTTKLMNRRTVNTVLAYEHHLIQRNDDSICCIVMADIDEFKNINDLYGHDIGDQVLEHTASVLNESLRRHDTVARFGGEEFLFVLPDMEIADAEKTIERIRKKLAVSTIEHHGKHIGVTASFGITQLCQKNDIKDSIKRADVALYQAKHWGRNKSVSIDKERLLNNEGVIYDELSDQARIKLFKQHCKAVC
jgi:diguanylate cyclase (GGDEF)-like protein